MVASHETKYFLKGESFVFFSADANIFRQTCASKRLHTNKYSVKLVVVFQIYYLAIREGERESCSK